jgi:hypothetical protein
MPPRLVAVLLALSLARPAAAQFPERTRRAFERSITGAAGITSFGNRVTGPLGTYRYKASLSLTAEGEVPVTRRSGVLALVTIAPLSKQKLDVTGGSTLLGRSLTVFSGDAALGWRLKPSAPVFIALGGGVTSSATTLASTGGRGVTEPHGTIVLGYDGRRDGRANFRVMFVQHLVVPKSPDESTYTAKSMALDWSIALGARIRFGRDAGRAGDGGAE